MDFKKKKEFHKEYIYLGLCSFVFLFLTVSLVLLLINNGDSTIKKQSTPSNKKMEVGYADYSEKEADFYSIQSVKKKTVKVKHKQVDYYEKNIDLALLNIKVNEDEFIVYNNENAKTPFISVVDKNGNEKFSTIINSNEVQVLDAFYSNKKYYIVYQYMKMYDASYEIAALDETGKIISKKYIESNITYISTFAINNSVVLLERKNNNCFMVFMNGDLDQVNEVKMNSDVFEKIKNARLYDLKISDDTVNLLFADSSNAYYIKYDIGTKSTKYVTTNIIKNSEYDLKFDENRIVSFNAKRLVVFDESLKRIKTIDYSKVELENPSSIKDYGQENEYGETIGVNNQILLGTLECNKKYSLLRSTTNYSTIYDVYDKDYNFVKRYVYNNEKYQKSTSELLMSFYENNTIYEFYKNGLVNSGMLINMIG